MKALYLMSRWAIVSAVLPLASAQSNPCLELGTLSPVPSSEAYQNLGNSYLEQGRLSCAAQAFASSFKLKPDDSKLALQLGRTLIADRKFQAARNVLEQAISLSPQSYDARMALGAALHELGDLSGALAQWEQAMQLQQQSALALDWVAKTRLELGDATSVVDLLHNAVRNESAEVDLLLASQRAGVLDQEYPVALDRLREHPDWTRLRSALAVTLVQRNRFDEALEVLSTGSGRQDESIHLLKMQVMVLSGNNKDVLPLAVSYLAGRPHDFEALYLAGLVHRRVGEYAAAKDELSEAVRLKPSHFDALFNLGAVEVALRQWKPAEEDLRRAIALDANAPEPRFQLATVLRNVGDIPSAKEQLQQYQHLQHLRAEHDRKVSLSAQAAQRLAAHDPAGAVELYRQLLALDEENAATQYNLAMACDAAGDVAAEKTALEAAVRINPKFALALNQLGYLQMRSGDPAAAEASFRAAIASVPEYAEAENNLGSLLVSQDRTAAAEVAFRAALRANPRSLEAWTNLAVILAEAARFREARDAANQALRVDPKDATALALLNALASAEGGTPR